jgi:hypothetical protein
MARADGGARFVFVTLLALLVLFAGAAVLILVRHPFFADDDTYSLCPKDRSSTTAVRPSRMIDESRPYQGPGPHHVVVVGPSDATDALPGDWHPPRATGWAHRVDTLELVACEYRYGVGDEGDLGSCGWKAVGGSAVYTVTTQSAKYDYHIFVAATGRLLTSFTVKGVYRECVETTVRHGPGGHETTPASTDLTELKRLLEPLVTRHVT